ncbi:unknown [Bacteroides sp. CAG:633]|nr:unknown [Bacteroides sp. CAG:633]
MRFYARFTVRFTRVACFTVMRSLRDCCGEISLENYFIGVKLASALTFHYL